MGDFQLRDPALLRRNELYLGILQLGLIGIRGDFHRGDQRYCEIEADHLHNVPEYIAGGDAANHLYYLVKEVPLYLTRVDLKIEARMNLVRWYVPLWIELESLIPIEGSPWRDEWLRMKAKGWNYGRPAPQ
jgi:hypothetical protein